MLRFGFALLFLINGVFIVGACGTSSSGNDGGDGSADVSKTVEPISNQDLAEACIRIHACGVERTARLADCIEAFQSTIVQFGQRELYQTMYDCVNQANGDCAQIRDCVGYGATTTKCGQPYQPRCDGNVAMRCDFIAKIEQALECDKGGLTCAVKNAGTSVEATCGRGKCDPATYKSECRDNRAWRCVGGSIEVDDCVEQGLQCRDNVAAVCEGKGRSCQKELFQTKCDGDTLVRCVGGYLSEQVCGKLPGYKVCDPVKLTCAERGRDCNKDEFFNKCDQSTLVACIDGKVENFDCKALGFAGCKAELYGAHCIPGAS